MYFSANTYGNSRLQQRVIFIISKF